MNAVEIEEAISALAGLGMKVAVEAVRKRLDAERATYFEGLSWITGLPERERVKKITQDLGSDVLLSHEKTLLEWVGFELA